MVVSPQLLAKMSVTPSYSGGVTSWSIHMNFRYPFAWRTVSSFVLREKSKGPPDNMVTLEVEKNVHATIGGRGGVLMIMLAIVIGPLTSHPYKAGTEHAGFSPDQARTQSSSAKRRGVLGESHEGFKYDVKMPWYARLVLGRSIMWHDIIDVEPDKQVLSEDGTNVSLRHLGSVRDMSVWRACEEDANVTVYKKKVDFDIRMPVGPTIMMQVAQPLMRWFQSKSHLCRELEVVAIREYLEDEARQKTEAVAAAAAQDGAEEDATTAIYRSVLQHSRHTRVDEDNDDGGNGDDDGDKEQQRRPWQRRSDTSSCSSPSDDVNDSSTDDDDDETCSASGRAARMANVKAKARDVRAKAKAAAAAGVAVAKQSRRTTSTTGCEGEE